MLLQYSLMCTIARAIYQKQLGEAALQVKYGHDCESVKPAWSMLAAAADNV